MKVTGNVLAGTVAGFLGLASGQASALEPDAALSNIPGRGINVVAGILDGTLDFGEAVLFAEGGLYGKEGLFEDYLRDFLITDEGFLGEHGFLGAIIGGDGVVAGFTSPDGVLVGTLLEISGNYDAFHGSHHASAQSSSASSLTSSGSGAQTLTEGATGLLSSGIAQGGGLLEGGALTQGAGGSALAESTTGLLSSNLTQGGGLLEGGALTQGAGLSSLTAMPSLVGGLVGN